MVKEKTVLGWKFECLGYKVDEVTKEVKKMFCKICKEFYANKNPTVAVQGRELLAKLINSFRFVFL